MLLSIIYSYFEINYCCLLQSQPKFFQMLNLYLNVLGFKVEKKYFWKLFCEVRNR